MTKLSVEAVALLQKVKADILAEPARLCMATWGRQFIENGEVTQDKAFFDDGVETLMVERPIPPCGTVACVAGWTAINGLKNLPTVMVNGLEMVDVRKIEDVEKTAQKLLGITEKEAQSLFYLPSWPAVSIWNYGAWPKQFGDAYAQRAPRGRAEAAAARIEHFIECGE